MSIAPLGPRSVTARPVTAWDVVLYPSTRAQTPSAEPGAPRELSPRAAFQEVLHDRAVLVDVRPLAERAAAGRVHPSLEPIVTDGPELVGWLGAEDVPVIMLTGSTGQDASVLAWLLRRRGGDGVARVAGGFAAWCRDGMPVLAA